jgi:Vitamin-D-receptor interacting Mediator subunit 4
VATHQQNYTRILALKQTTASLDAQIKSTLELLADTRKELLATPATEFPQSREVPYGELLAYAKRISKFTVPPMYRPPKKEDAQEQQNGELNGASTKANGSSISPADVESQAAGKDNKDFSVTSNLHDYQFWLETEGQMPFVPWPSEETIRRGALSQIQFMMEQDLDPSTQASLQEKEKLEDEEKKKAKEREAAAAIARRQSSTVGAAPTQAEPKRQQQQPVLMGIDLYDPEDE